MSLGTEFLQACKEGFASKDSSSIGGFLTDDFLMITPVTTSPRQGFLDWVSEGHSPAIIENMEVIYETMMYRYLVTTPRPILPGTKAKCYGAVERGTASFMILD